MTGRGSMGEPLKSSDDTGRKQKPQLFKPGQSGNPAGRPKGSRNALSEAFIAAVFQDFAKHGIASIAAMRVEKPNEYAKMIASLIPSQFQAVDVNGEGADLGITVIFAPKTND